MHIATGGEGASNNVHIKRPSLGFVMAGWLQLYAAPDSADLLEHGVPLGNNIQALGFKSKVRELGLPTFGLHPGHPAP